MLKSKLFSPRTAAGYYICGKYGVLQTNLKTHKYIFLFPNNSDTVDLWRLHCSETEESGKQKVKRKEVTC